LFCALSLTSFQATAQEDDKLLQLGGDLEFPMMDCVARLKLDGNIEILTEGGQQCVDVQVTDPVDLAIVLFEEFPQLDSEDTLNPGDAFYVAWGAQGQGEVSCQKSSDPSLAGWSGSTGSWGFTELAIPTEPAGAYILTLQCQDEDSGPVEKELELQVFIPPPQVTLTVDQPVQEPGGSVEFTWTSEHAQTCTALGGSDFPNWPTGEGIALNGSQQVNVPSTLPTDADYEFRVECENSVGDTSDAMISIQVLDDGLPSFCQEEERQPPEGFELRTRIRCSGSTSNGWQCNGNEVPDDGSDTTWSDVWGLDFPAGQTRRIFLPEDNYASLEFDSGTNGSSGGISFVGLQAFGSGSGNGRPLVSISECPGDFSDALNDGNRCRQRQLTTEGNFQWTRDSSSTTRCVIEPNTRYFLNITYATNTYPPVWSCFGDYDACGNNSNPTYSD